MTACFTQRWLLAAVLASMPGLAPAQSPPVDCQVICRSAQCTVHADGKPQPVDSTPKLIKECLSAKLVSDSLLTVLFQSSRGLERFAVANKQQGTEFATVEPKLRQAKCMNSVLCLESRDQARVAGLGGKGIDATASRRVGSPCAIGLPCGTILRPAAALPVALADAALQGQLQLRAQRGASGSLMLPVSAGTLTMPAGFLVAGAAYAYVLRDAAGTELAAGEFEVLSSKMQADVESDLAKTAGPDQALDRAEVLIDSKLYWDVSQTSR